MKGRIMGDTHVTSELPSFLASFEDLSQYLDEQFGDLEGSRRGAQFVEFAELLIPLTDEVRQFTSLSRSPKESHDDGVDLLTAINDTGEQLFVQSKFKIRSKDEFDSIISKFRHYEETVISSEQEQQLQFPGYEEAQPTAVFMIVTSSKLERIVAAYERSQLASRAYYDTLRLEGRLIILDGLKILSRLQGLYIKSYVMPAEVELHSENGWLAADGVRIGTVRGSELVGLYDKYGDALFFENIRDFLGITSGKKPKDDRESVNAKILETIDRAPAKMLERNNGITFRAKSFSQRDDKVLNVAGAAIVNGCQTTMCLVHSRSDTAAECLVQVKIVETEDPWEVARAANYQNQVHQMDLELARYLRPQVVQKAASDQGYAIATISASNINKVLQKIHRTQVDYDEMKRLYLGLFSRSPNYLFFDRYYDLRSDVLEVLYKQDAGGEERLFETLFLIVESARDALKECERIYGRHEYGHRFKRFHEPGKSRYRAYLAIVALCSALRENLADRSPRDVDEAARMRNFLRDARALLENNKQRYTRAFVLAYQVLAEVALQAWSEGGSEGQVAQEMYKRVSSTPFEVTFQSLLMKIDADALLAGES